MYSQTTVSATRDAIHSPLGRLVSTPTLKDLFKGQPVEIVFGRRSAVLGRRSGRPNLRCPGGRAARLQNPAGRSTRNHGLHLSWRRSRRVFPRPLSLHRRGGDRGQGSALFPRSLLFAGERIAGSAATAVCASLRRDVGCSGPDAAARPQERGGARRQLSARRSSQVRRAGNEIELPMSRLDMADYLGLTIETVSRMMTSLVRRGLIHATGRHRIALRKLSALRDIAGRDEDEAMRSLRRRGGPSGQIDASGGTDPGKTAKTRPNRSPRSILPTWPKCWT